MQSGDKSIAAVGKAAATTLRHAVQGLRAGHVLAAGAPAKTLARHPAALYGTLFVFRAFADAEARATCAAFGAPCTAAAVLRASAPGLLPLRRTAEHVVRRAFGPRTKDEGRVLAAPTKEGEEKDGEEKEEKEPPKDEQVKEEKEPKKEEEEGSDGLVPVLDLDALVRETEATLAGVRAGVRAACEGVRAARVAEVGAAHERTRAEMLEVLRTERARLDAALAAACASVDRDAEQAAAALRHRHGTRVANAARAVADADGAILADANANPLAEPPTTTTADAAPAPAPAEAEAEAKKEEKEEEKGSDEEAKA